MSHRAPAILWLLAVCGSAFGGPESPEAAPDVERVELEHGFYWLATPDQADPRTRYPLIVCLHGTDTSAAEILSFWRSLEAGLPFIFIAPQAGSAGWCDTDLTFLEELVEQIAGSVSFDPDRVLLAGHSAGGAMAFHLLYVEEFAATAVAVTANYLPPTVTAEMVARRREVPLFYAVGEGDLNRPRMREGLHLLRGAGARVTVERPRIGHVLDPEVGQHALDWFSSACRKLIDRQLVEARLAAEAGREAYVGPQAAALEELLRQREAHFPDQIAVAGDLLAKLQQSGHRLLAEARGLALQSKPLEARDVLLAVERRYHPSSVAVEAKQRRLELEALPRVAQQLGARDEREARRKADDLWRSILVALTDTRVEEDKRQCRNLLALYPESGPAADARRVLDEFKAAAGTP